MKIVVVGGHSRNIGKTSVMAGLIRDMRLLDWTAVKITQYGHGICSQDGAPCDCAPEEHAFMLTEEKDPTGRADTCRFLAAGAKRSLWLRARQGQLAESLPFLERALAQDDWVMFESNSILNFIKPSLYLVVLDSHQTDFKPSALEFLDHADALVPIESRMDGSAWPAIGPLVFAGKPLFPVAARDYFSPDLCRFVREKLLTPQGNPRGEAENRSVQEKELPCQH